MAMANWVKRSDAALVRQTLQGKRASFEELIQRHASMARALALAHVRVRDDADDVVQDAFVEAFRCLDTLRDPGKFGAWLAALVRHRAARVKAQRKRDADYAESQSGTESAVHPDPAQTETWTRVRQAVDELEAGAREVVVLRYFAGKSSREIGAILDLSPAAVRKRLQRARHDLAEQLLQEAGAADDGDRRSVKGIVVAVSLATPDWSAAQTGGTAFGATVWSAGSVKIAGLAAAGAIAIAFGVMGTQSEPPAKATADTGLADAPVETVLPATQTAVTQASQPANDSTASSITSEFEGPESWPVHVRVTDPDGVPQPGVAVTLALKSQARDQYSVSWGLRPVYFTTQMRTNGRGIATFSDIPNLDVEKPVFEVTARGAGTIGVTQTVAHYVYQPETERDLVVRPTEEIAGRVIGPDGSPIKGAWVYLQAESQSEDRGPWMEGMRSTTTNSQGEFSIPVMAGYLGSFETHASGYATAWAASVPSGTRDVEIRMERGRRLEGTVVDAELGEPVAGILLVTDSRRVHAVSDENGRFAFDSLRAEETILQCADDEYLLAGDVPKISLVHSDELNAIVRVERGLELTGSLTDANTGEPLPGVPVIATDIRSYQPTGLPRLTTAQAREGITDADGRYVIRGLWPSTYNVDYGLHATVPVHVPPTAVPTANFVLRRDGTARYDLTVERGEPVRGRVIDRDGVGRAGFSVNVWGNTDSDFVLGLAESFKRPVTDEDGWFTAYPPESVDEIYVRAHRPGWITNRLGPLAVTQFGEEPLELVAARSGSMSGMVSREDEESNSNRISIRNAYHGPVSTLSWQMDGLNDYVETDGMFLTRSGYFFAGALYPGEYELESSGAVTTAAVLPGQRTYDVRLDVPKETVAGGEVAGYVSLFGEPLEGAKVYVGPTLGDKTKPDGSYHAVGVEEGKHVVRVHASEVIDGIRVNRTATQTILMRGRDRLAVDFPLGNGTATIEGFVTLNGEPYAPSTGSVSLTLSRPGGYEENIRVTPNDLGLYRVEGIPAGMHTLHYRNIPALGSVKRVRGKADLEVSDGEVLRHDFHLMTGHVEIELTGMKTGEIGRVMIVPASSIEPEMTPDVVRKLERAAVVMVMVHADDTFRFDEVATGDLAVYFGAWDATKTDTAGIYGSLRYTTGMIHVQQGETTAARLRLR
jgi:RNA polymerase sigma factor (sigma-70 family)